MTHENDKRDAGNNGRRKEDAESTAINRPPPADSFYSWLVRGITIGGVISVIFFSGRVSHTLDTAVAINEKQDVQILELTKLMYEEQAQSKQLLEILKNQGEQTSTSDERFEKMLKESNDLQRDNREKIIILNQKISSLDNTSVNLYALR